MGRIIVHPEYNPKSLVHDIAVLLVNKPFVYTETVGRVCLPDPQTEPGQVEFTGGLYIYYIVLALRCVLHFILSHRTWLPTPSAWLRGTDATLTSSDSSPR